MRGPPQPCQPPCQPPQAEADVGANAAAPSEAAAMATSESLRNMIVSSGFGAVGAIDKSRRETTAAKLNAAGTAASGRVHLGEIVVIHPRNAPVWARHPVASPRQEAPT